jgi:hypothetical protein
MGHGVEPISQCVRSIRCGAARWLLRLFADGEPRAFAGMTPQRYDSGKQLMKIRKNYD